MNGILNVYKERGFTSHDVVAKLRGIAKQKKIGHTGTLDPDAEGVLPVCLGNATKLCDVLTDKNKTYEAVILFGIETDTQDIGGTVLEERPVTVGRAEFEAALSSFRGEIMQVPPMYSAIKVNGRKLYELARQGKEVERQARPVTIHELEVLSVFTDENETGGALREAKIRVSCTKGTYIRTLCHDIGRSLGCGACMKSLLRTRSGRFTVEDSLTLARIQELSDQGLLEETLLSVDSMYPDYPRYRVSGNYRKRLYAGNPVPTELLLEVTGEAPASAGPERALLYDAEGIFTGIYEYDGEQNSYRPVKMFLPL